MMLIFHNARREIIQRIAVLERSNRIDHKFELLKEIRLIPLTGFVSSCKTLHFNT